MGWSLVDHTGDLGLEIEAGSLEELFAETLRGFTDCLTDVDRVRRLVARRVELTAPDRELLLVDWLQEALFLFETEQLVFAAAKVEVTPCDGPQDAAVELRAVAHGERFDTRRHPLKAPIKAITYHALELARQDMGWRARLVFDL